VLSNLRDKRTSALPRFAAISLALINKLRVLRVISLDDINLAGPKLRGSEGAWHLAIADL
jgi:hypothetical protein